MIHSKLRPPIITLTTCGLAIPTTVVARCHLTPLNWANTPKLGLF